MILQLSCSDINKKSWILFHAFSLLKTKALPPKFTFKFRLPICGQGNKEKFGGFGRITWFLFFSKEMDPHLGHWQNQKQRSKLLNFALKKKKQTKKRFYPNKSHFCRSVCFPVSWYKLQESTGTAGLQHRGETQGSSHKSGWWQAEIPGPSSSSSCQPRGWWNETPGSSSNTCNPGT